VESWLNQQLQYDLWRVEKKRRRLRVAKLITARKIRAATARERIFRALATTPNSQFQFAVGLNTPPKGRVAERHSGWLG
jgi:hypothetical protein